MAWQDILEECLEDGRLSSWIAAKPDKEKRLVFAKLFHDETDPSFFRWIKSTVGHWKSALVRSLNIDAANGGHGDDDVDEEEGGARAGSTPSKAPPRLLALDVEKVQGPSVSRGNGKPRFKLLAGRVAVVEFVNNEYITIYDEYVNQTDVTDYLSKFSGMTPQKMKSGLSPETLREQLAQLFEGNKVIVLDGLGDFDSCALPMSSFDVYDLKNYFVRSDNSWLGLKTLAWHFFRINMQKSKTHSPSVDARFTLRLYKEIVLEEIHEEWDDILNVKF